MEKAKIASGTPDVYKTKGAFGNLPKRVLPADSKVRFNLELLDDFYLANSAAIKVLYIRDDWRMEDGAVAVLTPGLEKFWQQVAVTSRNGRLEFEIELKGEFEHYIRIAVETPACHQFEELYFYTLGEDMLRWRAFKGNPHSHSTRSDGGHEPGLVAAYMRRAGFDFTAVTDHHKYEPSLEAIKAMSAFDSGLECYRGEEVESFGVGVNHILSLGASASVTTWKHAPESDFHQRVAEREKEFSDLPPHERKYAAQFEVLTDKIREFGGLSVFCHPYWKQNARYASTTALTDFILRRGRFDALEVGNYIVARMALMNAKILELAAECRFHKPFIGSSDWHARPTQEDNIDYTVIFAKSPGIDDFQEAVRAERCVAVGGHLEEFPFGSFRLVKYALFLMEHFFPKDHDRLCREQGELLLRAHGGDKKVLPRIAALKNELEKVYDSFFYC